jgi:2-methylcitrate dehydratase PrpD
MTAQPAGWSDDGATHDFAAFVSGTSYEDLPREVVRAVTWTILDTLAVTVAGLDTPAVERLATWVGRDAGEPRATVLGLPFGCDPARAALVNGTSGHVLDYDDYCFAMSGHPSVTLLPAALALAESRGLSGRDLIRGYAVGFEAAIMLSHTVNPHHYNHGWHGTGTVGTIGASCAAASVLSLPHDAVVRAIGLGASSAAGLRQNFGTDAKPLHAGNAARSGVTAAELAELGFGTDEHVLEGHWGFFHTFTDGPRRDWPKPGQGFGDPWSVLDPGITTKLFPSCGSTHAALGGILELRRQGLRADNVARIDVDVTDVAAGNLMYPRPRTGLEAKFSMQYCLARALTNGELGLDDFTDEAVTAGDLDELLPRIHCAEDPRLTAAYVWGSHRPAVLTVQTTGGDVVRHRAESPPGSPGHFSRDELLTKVADCLGRGNVVGTVDEIVSTVEALDRCEDLRELTRLFHPRP